MVKAILFRIHIEEPSKQQVGVNPFDQLSFASDRTEPLQKQRFEKSFRRNSGASQLVVRPGERLIHLRKDSIDAPLDRSQRMIPPNPRFHIDRIEQLLLRIAMTTH